MKREGHQHGMVRSYMVLPSPFDLKPKSKIVNKLDGLPTAGMFVKVPSKPNNHSKFTGKCGKSGCTECHSHPASKSKDKAKGTKKLKSSNTTLDHGSLAWRVVGNGQPLGYNGKSATGILSHMSNDDYYENEVEDEEEEVIVRLAASESLPETEDGDDVMRFSYEELVWDDQSERDEGWFLV